MQDTDITAISNWLVEEGLAGRDEPSLVSGFCLRSRAVGLDLSRAVAIVDTLHPVYEGRAFPWRAMRSKRPRTSGGTPLTSNSHYDRKAVMAGISPAMTLRNAIMRIAGR